MSFLNFEMYDHIDKEKAIKSLVGDNLKGILIVLPKEEYIEKEEFLSKIMSSVKIEVNQDCCTLPVEDGDVVIISQLFGKKEINNVLVFGLDTKQIGLNYDAPLYKPIKIIGRMFITGHSLYHLDKNENKQDKLKLWNTLKAIFLESENR